MNTKHCKNVFIYNPQKSLYQSGFAVKKEVSKTEVFRNIVLILIAAGALLFGYYLMSKLDKSLNDNRDSLSIKDDEKEPSAVLLNGTLSDDEIVEEIRRFRESHECIRIVLYDSDNPELFEGIGLDIGQR